MGDLGGHHAGGLQCATGGLSEQLRRLLDIDGVALSGGRPFEGAGFRVDEARRHTVEVGQYRMPDVDCRAIECRAYQPCGQATDTGLRGEEIAHRALAYRGRRNRRCDSQNGRHEKTVGETRSRQPGLSVIISPGCGAETDKDAPPAYSSAPAARTGAPPDELAKRTNQRSTRAEPPPANFSTSALVAIEVSPGVVIANAP